jgi:hypothetical protein
MECTAICDLLYPSPLFINLDTESKLMSTFLTFRGPYIVIYKYSYNKNQRDALISQIYFGIELYMFRKGLLSIIRSLVLYTQQ